MVWHKELREKHRKYWYWKVATDFLLLGIVACMFYIELNTGMQIIEFNERFENEGCEAICSNPYIDILDFNISNISDINGLRHEVPLPGDTIP